MDKLDGALREYVSHQADLLGAIRLPNDAFKKNANTEVTTDIVMLRKRQPGELPDGPAWKAIGEITNSLGETIPVNEYYAEHPEMMLGEMRLEGRMYRNNEPTLAGNGKDLAEQLAQAVASLPKNLFSSARQPRRRATGIEQIFPAPEHIKPNAYTLVNDRIGIRDGDKMRVVEGLSSRFAQRIRGMIRVRDAVRRCLRAQLNGTDEERTRGHAGATQPGLRPVCHPAWLLSERANTSAFRGDPDLPLLLSLEHYDDQSKRAAKAAIFRERTIQTDGTCRSRSAPPRMRCWSRSVSADALTSTTSQPAPSEAVRVSARPQRNNFSQSTNDPLGNRGRVSLRQRSRQTGRRRSCRAGG